MNKPEQINIAIKFAEIDDKPYSSQYEGWVSRLVQILNQTIAFYFDQAVAIHLKKETDLINEQEFKDLDALIYILSPAFLFSSNITVEISAIEKAVLFDTEHLNSKIHKVLKGPVEASELPATISMGTFHYFYQLAKSGGTTYETLFDWDNAAVVREKYWDSFTNLLLSLLKSLQHPKYERFVPSCQQTFFLGTGDIGQLWNRTDLLGELKSRGVKVLPDNDHSIEVKHLKDPAKFYLEKSNLAIHFPEEFLPVESGKLAVLADLSWLKRYIWFDPEAEKDLEKKKGYDELKLKIKDLDHVEVISAGLEELKEILFSATQEQEVQEEGKEEEDRLKVYLICSENFPEDKKEEIIQLLRERNMEILLIEQHIVLKKRERHYRNLKEADFCLVAYDGENPDWVQANINEVKKSKGLNPEKERKIKLGLITLKNEVPEVVGQHSGTLRMLSALSESFKEDLNSFVDEK